MEDTFGYHSLTNIFEASFDAITVNEGLNIGGDVNIGGILHVDEIQDESTNNLSLNPTGIVDIQQPLQLPNGNTNLDWFEQDNLFQITFTGNAFANDQTVTLKLKRIGDFIHIKFPQVLAPGDVDGLAGQSINTGMSAIPTQFRPDEKIYKTIVVRDNSVWKLGTCVVRETGALEIYPDVEPADFQDDTGEFGWRAFSVSFSK